MIFLSVGYAACHWCHVMERESFVDREIAQFMNEHFVCIKVDREERPDVDQIYMLSVQLVSGHGGWPMSVFLLPDTRPFWGGTYFPARDGDRGTSVGFLTVLKRIDEAWTKQRGAVEQQADALTKLVRANQDPGGDSGKAVPPLEVALVDRVADALKDQFDPEFGGFGYSPNEPNRPKFPEPANLWFLIDRMQRESVESPQRESARAMLLRSLDGMISGAMVDHLGGGFHRYSVDRRWQIPHFEKMLYDNGQLASVYALAYEATGREEYKFVVEGICDFVLRELTAAEHGFFSALDADSDGEEGKFYRWTAEELERLPSIENFELAADLFRLGGKPNFEGEFYVPDPGRTLSEIAQKRSLSFAALVDEWDPVRESLFEHRKQHPRPLTDIKILTAWNGLMIRGLADAGRILEREDYTETARAAAEFVLGNLRDEKGHLLRSYAGGKAQLNGYVDDYAFLANGLLALHRATGDEKWLGEARSITDQQLERFWDNGAGGFFFTSSDHQQLIVRVKDPIDGALPSGASVSAENLQMLWKLTGDERYRTRLRETLQSMAPLFRRAPAGVPRAAAVLAEYLDHESKQD